MTLLQGDAWATLGDRSRPAKDLKHMKYLEKKASEAIRKNEYEMDGEPTPRIEGMMSEVQLYGRRRLEDFLLVKAKAEAEPHDDHETANMRYPFQTGRVLVGLPEFDMSLLSYHETALCGHFCLTRPASHHCKSPKLKDCSLVHSGVIGNPLTVMKLLHAATSI